MGFKFGLINPNTWETGTKIKLMEMGNFPTPMEIYIMETSSIISHMETEFIIFMMEQSIKVHGSQTLNRVTAKKNDQMGLYILDFSKKVKKTAKEYSDGRTVAIMRDNLKRTF